MAPTLKIMYVDDEVDIRCIVEFALEDEVGMELRLCASGQEALDLAPTFRPDLILLDVMIPAMDGPTTLQRLRQLAWPGANAGCLRHCQGPARGSRLPHVDRSHRRHCQAIRSHASARADPRPVEENAAEPHGGWWKRSEARCASHCILGRAEGTPARHERVLAGACGTAGVERSPCRPRPPRSCSGRIGRRLRLPHSGQPRG